MVCVSVNDIFQVVQLPESLSQAQGVLCEPASCILNGWKQNGMASLDDNVLIMGAGIAGLMFASLFHHHGFRSVLIMGAGIAGLMFASLFHHHGFRSAPA